MRIGLQIKIAMVGEELSAADLARKVGMSRAHLSEVQSGKKNPSIVTINKLCEALGYDLMLVKKEA
jgi:transcriptional regulator with XRE-family HTH domain